MRAFCAVPGAKAMSPASLQQAHFLSSKKSRAARVEDVPALSGCEQRQRDERALLRVVPHGELAELAREISLGAALAGRGDLPDLGCAGRRGIAARRKPPSPPRCGTLVEQRPPVAGPHDERVHGAPALPACGSAADAPLLRFKRPVFSSSWSTTTRRCSRSRSGAICAGVSCVGEHRVHLRRIAALSEAWEHARNAVRLGGACAPARRSRRYRT
jgi:hypothetical protein